MSGGDAGSGDSAALQDARAFAQFYMQPPNMVAALDLAKTLYADFHVDSKLVEEAVAGIADGADPAARASAMACLRKAWQMSTLVPVLMHWVLHAPREKHKRLAVGLLTEVLALKRQLVTAPEVAPLLTMAREKLGVIAF